MPRSQERQRDLVMELRRRRHGDGVHLVEQLAIVRQRARAAGRRPRPRALGSVIDDRGQPRAVDAGQQPRVVLAQVADADDRDPQGLSHAAPPAGRPTTAMPAASAASKNFVAVHDQRLARVDRDRRRAGRLHRLDRGDADDGDVEAHVLVRLGDLDDPGARARRSPRRGGSPRRSPPSPRRRRPPCPSRRWSGRCRARRRRRPCGSRRRSRRAPRPSARGGSGCRLLASSGSRNAVEFSSSIPSPRSTSATAEMSASVFLARSLVRTDSRVRSGMMPEKILACLTCPAMTA